MTIQQLRGALNGRPFKPFALVTSDGREYCVPHPEWIWIKPGSERTVVVGVHGRDAVAVLDLLHVTTIITGSGTRKPRKAG